MNEVHERKDHFVRHELLQLVRVIDERILKASYEVHDDGEEFVEITWAYNDGSSYRVRIRVTADSLKAIVRDVLKHI